jgi:hypothetical protein
VSVAIGDLPNNTFCRNAAAGKRFNVARKRDHLAARIAKMNAISASEKITIAITAMIGL